MSTPQLHVPRTLVLVGLMGAGKTNIGRRLAQRLGLGFTDADSEIESAAGETIEEIFGRRGEAAFREGERKVIARLLGNPVHVLATGGGAFMDPETRALIRERGISIWLRADLELLHQRVSRRNNRPLLKQGNPREILALRARLNEIYVRHTGQALETIATAVERDKFLSPLEAKDFGIVDEVVESRPGQEEPHKGFK